MPKRTILLIKIKVPGKKMEVFETKKKSGWTDKEIRQFVKGVQSGFPGATITTSTISQ